MPKLIVLGIRGVPAQHGGFETFAEKLAPYLVQQGWDVTVYCQEEGEGGIYESEWERVRRIHIPVTREGSLGSVIFDWKAAWHAKDRGALVLTLGYNTAIFNVIQRMRGQKNVINMDGIEWRRTKWGQLAKAWFWMNDWIGCWVGNHLIADHPAIAEHLKTRVFARKITTIPYGGDEVMAADESALAEFNLLARRFSVIIARPEPENSFLEIITAFSAQKRDHKLVVLGRLDEKNNSYHRALREAASDEIIFLGAIYDKRKVGALRYFSQYYMHGHTVGGTNPSLVEAMGAGCAVIAHDNRFNRWVAGQGACYFNTKEDCEKLFGKLINNENERAELAKASRLRFEESFTWERVLSDYEKLLYAQL